MKTSIVIPVINDDFVFRCLKTIIRNWKNKIPFDKEVIIINDKKSNDRFSKKLKNFCSNKKIKYYRAEKPGASFNRNKGIDLAKGKNIIFIDSDCFPSKNWVSEMEKSLEKFDLVEGRVSYASDKKPLFDRFVENKSAPNRFLTANLGIKKEVGNKCKFDDRFIVFREDTDFGLMALEKGFISTFNKKAEVFHKKSRFTIKKFIFERKRYIGEPLLFKKHKNNPLLNRHIPRIWRISHPTEVLFLGLIVSSIFYFWQALLFTYFLPGLVYSLKKYLIDRRTFRIKDTILILLLIPITMALKRFYIWKGAIKFRSFLL